MWCIYTLKYYSAIKQNQTMNVGGNYIQLQKMYCMNCLDSEKQMSLEASRFISSDLNTYPGIPTERRKTKWTTGVVVVGQ